MPPKKSSYRGKAFAATKEDTEKREEYNEVLERIKKFLGREVTARESWERKAYVNVMMKEGHHNINDEGMPDARDPNAIRRPVNKFKSVLRGLKNGVTFNDPIIDVIPDNGQDVDQSELDLASVIVRTEFAMAGEENEGMRDVLRTVVDEAALKSFCVVSVLPNNDSNSARINDIRVHDSFDVFFDNQVLSKAQIMVISSFEDKNWLASEGYKNVNDGLGGDTASHSGLKNEFERNHGKKEMDDVNNILVDNVYYIEHEEEDENDLPVKGKKKIMHCVVSGDAILQEPQELTGFKHLGQLFFIYYMEKSKFVKYPTPWMSDIVPLQRSLNDSSENIDTILHWIAKVRFLQRSGSQNTVQVIGDRHVQKVRYEGERPTFMEMPQVPPDLFRQTQMREGQIEDQAGVHASSMGKSSGDRVSGRKEAVLAAGDADNVAEPVRNLETFLSRIFTQILDNAADNVKKVKKIVSETGESFDALGELAYQKLKKNEKKNITPIRRFTNIKTTIIPGSNALIASGRQETIQLIQYFLSAGMEMQAEVLFDVLMRQTATGATRDIAKMLERKQEEANAENADLLIVKSEIDKLGRGEPVTATPEQPHEIHLQMKMLALQQLVQGGAAQKSEDDPIFQTFMSNISQHQSMLQGGEKTGIDTIIKGVK